MYFINMISRVASTGSNPGDAAFFQWHTPFEVHRQILHAATNAWSRCMTE